VVTRDFLIAVAWSVAGAVIAGCIRINPEHCIVNGGEFLCADRRCAMTRGIQAEGDEDGCVDEVASGFVHVKYGLPSRLGALGDEDLDTVNGVLLRVVSESGVAAECVINEDVVIAVAGPWARVDKVRKHLDRSGRTLETSARPTQDQVDAISVFNYAVDYFVEVCDGGTTPTGSDTGADPTDGATDSVTEADSTSCGASDGCEG
jgi:hypothetical protein